MCAQIPSIKKNLGNRLVEKGIEKIENNVAIVELFIHEPRILFMYPINEKK